MRTKKKEVEERLRRCKMVDVRVGEEKEQGQWTNNWPKDVWNRRKQWRINRQIKTNRQIGGGAKIGTSINIYILNRINLYILFKSYTCLSTYPFFLFLTSPNYLLMNFLPFFLSIFLPFCLYSLFVFFFLSSPVCLFIIYYFLLYQRLSIGLSVLFLFPLLHQLSYVLPPVTLSLSSRLQVCPPGDNTPTWLR